MLIIFELSSLLTTQTKMYLMLVLALKCVVVSWTTVGYKDVNFNVSLITSCLVQI